MEPPPVSLLATALQAACLLLVLFYMVFHSSGCNKSHHFLTSCTFTTCASCCVPLMIRTSPVRATLEQLKRSNSLPLKRTSFEFQTLASSFVKVGVVCRKFETCLAFDVSKSWVNILHF
ncbi:hypothetical protein DAEQUDRAFT_211757 [Daedalea quercina L-15889]|uniref:Uncharacterized protein n=1 Tax=Daedalea quercina L-15889 TaxID=1314783 RepID=A0A165RB49_9APHY|nr:hypothetical protein DAEQUDRAFT_211757 [Daedalea quercina L-15889]